MPDKFHQSRFRGCLSITVLLLRFETSKGVYIRSVSPLKSFTRIASLLVSLSHPVFFTLIYPYDEALFVNQHPSDLRHRSDDANFQHASLCLGVVSI